MTVLLAVLKWIGIVLLILLAVLLIIVLLVLLVPFRYSVQGHVEDPEDHEEIPFELWKNNAGLSAEVTWLLHLLRARFIFPAGDKLEVRILGRKFPIERFMKKKEPPEEEEKQEEEQEKEKKSLQETLTALEKKADQAAYGINYYQRTLTGTCGRRALDAALPRLIRILKGIAPSKWFLKGTVGLGDPYRNGRLCEICSILYPFAEEQLDLDQSWYAYRMNLNAEAAGGIRLGSIVGGVLPLLFDKNCKKLVKKLRAGKAKIKAYGERAEQPKDGGQNGRAE